MSNLSTKLSNHQTTKSGSISALNSTSISAPISKSTLASTPAKPQVCLITWQWHRVWAIVMRHFYNFRRSYDRLTDSFYWPVMDLIVWGLSSRWLEGNQQAVSDVALMILTGLVFWQIVWRSNYEISVNLLEEVWNQNLANLFSTPLTVAEWISAVMLIGFLKNFITLLVGAGGMWLLYSLNIFTVGWWLLPFFFLLLVSGWFMGFIAGGLIIRHGQKIQTLAWTMGFLFAPFSAVYYPLSVLPTWARSISALLPTTYIFEGMRAVLKTGQMSWNLLFLSVLLNAIYLSLSIAFFVKMFNKRKEQGLVQMD